MSKQIKCECGKPAKYNFQRLWVVATIVNPNDRGTDYKDTGIPDNQDPTGDDNLFLCRHCALKDFDGQYQLIQRGEWKSI